MPLFQHYVVAADGFGLRGEYLHANALWKSSAMAWNSHNAVLPFDFRMPEHWLAGTDI